MNIVYWLLATTALIVSTFAQTPNGTRKAWNDSLWIDRDGTYQLVGDYIDTQNQTTLRFKDTTALKLALFDSTDIEVAVGGMGNFRHIDSTYNEGSFAFASASAGKQWCLTSFLDSREVSTIQLGMDPTGAIDNSAMLQRALNHIDAAGPLGSARGGGTLIVTKGSWGLSQTVTLPGGVDIVGLKGKQTLENSLPEFLWIGASGDTMFVQGDNDAIWYQITGVGFSGADSCNYGLWYEPGTDLGCRLDRVFFNGFRIYGLALVGGVTNFAMSNFRFDGIGWTGAAGGLGSLAYQDSSYCIYVRYGSGHASFRDFTLDPHGGGFMLIDGSSSTSSARPFINVDGAKIEINEKITAPNALFYIKNNGNMFPVLSLEDVNITYGITGSDSLAIFDCDNATYENRIRVMLQNVTAGETGGIKVFGPNMASTRFSSTNARRISFLADQPLSSNSALRARAVFNTDVSITALTLGNDSSATPVASFPNLKWVRPQTAMATPVAGAVEYDGRFMTLVDSSSTRRKLAKSNYTQAVGTISPSGSPYKYGNGRYNAAVVTVTGGTVSQIDIRRGATTVATGMTVGAFTLAPFDTLIVTYSSGPTMKLLEQ